ncbi:MAG: hypothetical protein NC094_11945 [Bacteroidales bacterium]|nr:hypothetical protein [Lachnoclostridium sp.]MCM1385293.1 hypothetical protein [Lachnoclostridium sp.]MCM1466121.1 hypothetical protein [Bacteroidales bacterium]
MGKNNCGNCKYYVEFEGVCCCADSDEVANFTDRDFVCKRHEAKAENEAQEGLFGEE